jgi:hypothetical protein
MRPPNIDVTDDARPYQTNGITVHESSQREFCNMG